MTTKSKVQATVITLALGMTGVAGAFAQESQPRPWRKVIEAAPQTQQPEQQDSQASPEPGGYPSSFPSGNPEQASPRQRPDSGQQHYQYPPQGQPAPRNMAEVPSQLTVRPGTYVTVSVNNPLSSDHNREGDAFTATLTKPLVIDGVVVAHAGQTIAGRVTEARRAGMVAGTSRLGIELTELTLADGSQIPIQCDLLTRDGRTSVGSDVGAIGTTTGLGAIIGAAADGGRGAAIGAGAGAAAGIIGVLLTRGQPTVLYPETLLTFRILAPVTIVTDRAPQAFRYADSSDYRHALQPRSEPPARVAYGPGPNYPRPHYYGPSAIWGPSFGVYIGPRYHYGRRW